jgi:N-acetylmuramoyl-L-alanine amidase
VTLSFDLAGLADSTRGSTDALLTQAANRDIIEAAERLEPAQMPKDRQGTETDQLRWRRIGCIMRQVQFLLLVVMVAAAALGAHLAREQGLLFSSDIPPFPGTKTTAPGTMSSTSMPSTIAEATPTPGRPTLSPIPKGKRIGVLAGHYGPENDPGAVCPDGLREVDINLAVAERVVDVLRSAGYEVDLLEEYDDRLQGYRAHAFLSIHSDACDAAEASGFKVARVSTSAIPEVEDRLVGCLYQEYERITGLPRHDYSITPDMHGYHAFLKIDPRTPGAIIEMGFMGADRYILTRRPDLLARGILAGLLLFLES